MNHTAIKHDLNCNWTFVFPTTAKTCVGETDELFRLVDDLFDTFDDFVIPTGAHYDLQHFSEGSIVPTADSGSPDDRLDSNEVRESDEQGLDSAQLRPPFDEDESQDPYVPRAFIDHTRVKIRLDQGDVYVDRDNHSALYRGDTRLEKPPQKDPISFELFHAPNIDENEVDSDFVFYLRVKVHTDIWFTDTELGRVNAERLTQFLGRIETELGASKIHRNTEWTTAEQLRKIF